MRDDAPPLDPRRLYDALTTRLARKLERAGRPTAGPDGRDGENHRDGERRGAAEAPPVEPADFAIVADLLDQAEARPQDPRLWLSLSPDGRVIDGSRAAMARLGLNGPGDRIEGITRAPGPPPGPAPGPAFGPALGSAPGPAQDTDNLVLLPDPAGRTLLCTATRTPDGRNLLVEELSFRTVTPADPQLAGTIMALWKLTPAEAGIALALLHGEAPAEIATRTGRAIGTVRQAIKSVLVKMQVHSQAQAVARLALVALNARRRFAPQTPDTAARRILPHRDSTGAGIVTWRFGAPGGVPVLFFHGALFGILPGPGALTAAAWFGLDILAPERPGYGMTPLPSRDKSRSDPVALAITLAVDRARAVLDDAGIGRAQLFAHDVGTVYACAFARAHPDRVSAIICAPATPPMTGWSQTADMPPLHRVSALVAQKAPPVMEAMVRLGLRRVAREGLGSIPRMIFADSAHDRDVLLRPEAAGTLEALYLSVTEQAAAGFLRDMFVTNLDWSGWLSGITCPVRFLHGAQSRTVSLPALRRTCAALPDATLTVIPGAGHTLPLTHPGHAFREALILSTDARRP